MGLQPSMDKLLHKHARDGNIEAIKLLSGAGAGLEWINSGMTPLMSACTDSKRYNVAKTLIELGADVNAYRRGFFAGTPLHYAARRGLEMTVELLLSHGADALVMNDDGQTALGIARYNRYSNVVRAIENHICLFSGWLHQLYEPRSSHLCASNQFREKEERWVVVLPCGARKPTKPEKLYLAIYSGLKNAHPRSLTHLSTANVDELNFNHPNPSVLISTSTRRIKLGPVEENGKQQLQQFCNACKGITQVMHPDPAKQTAPPSVPSAPPVTPPWVPSAQPSAPPSVPSAPPTPPPLVPSAPPISDMVDDRPVHYSPIDSTKEKDGGEFSRCVVCLDAPIEGACIPCGHMAGCMSCLTEVKGNNWGCPVCCNKIYHIVQLCAV